MFCICGFTLIWNDFGLNLFQPAFLVSSNFVNLNAMCGNMPGVVNPACGSAPDSILVFWLAVTFGWLGFAIVIDKLFRGARRRWPNVSTPILMAIVLIGGGLAVDLIFEIPAVALGLWTYTTGPAIPLGEGLRHPYVAIVFATLYYGIYFIVRAARDDHGRRLVERGLEHYAPRVQRSITLMALYTIFQIVTWGPGTLPFMAAELWNPVFTRTPNYLVNDLCDAPGVEGTRYGPCPGSPGYRMPIKGDS